MVCIGLWHPDTSAALDVHGSACCKNCIRIVGHMSSPHCAGRAEGHLQAPQLSSGRLSGPAFLVREQNSLASGQLCIEWPEPGLDYPGAVQWNAQTFSPKLNPAAGMVNDCQCGASHLRLWLFDVINDARHGKMRVPSETYLWDLDCITGCLPTAVWSWPAEQKCRPAHHLRRAVKHEALKAVCSRIAVGFYLESQSCPSPSLHQEPQSLLLKVRQ